MDNNNNNNNNNNNKYIYLSVIGIIFLIIFYPAIKGLMTRWEEDANFSHGFIIPFVSIYLIWEKRKDLIYIPEEKSIWSLSFFILGIILYILGFVGQTQFIMGISFYISLISLVFYLGGKTLGKKLMFPMLFLIFMIPLPYSVYDRITIPLKFFATKMSSYLIAMIGIPFRLDGVIIRLPNTSLEVADACSGLRSLISLMALGAIFAYYNQKSIKKQSILFLSSIPIAVAGNILRITLTTWIAFVYGQKIATSFLHEFSGVLIFIFGLIFLYFIGELLNWAKK
ncbi:exosortase [Candidatus Desantisbacteria bacterium]|nr:exosortase [Candidatus Desantisbacteria bacterium]